MSVLLIFILFFSCSIVSGEVLKKQKSFREFLGLSHLRPIPIEPQITSLLVILRTSNGKTLDATVNLYNSTHSLIASEMTKDVNHVLFKNIILSPSSVKNPPSYILEVISPTTDTVIQEIRLTPGIENLEEVYLKIKIPFASCFDSDGGINSLVAGTANMILIPKKEGTRETKQDQCYGNVLVEQYCDEDRAIAYERITCPGKCSAGKCIVAPYCKEGVCIPLENASCYSYFNENNVFISGEILLAEKSIDYNKKIEPVKNVPRLPIIGNVIAGGNDPVPTSYYNISVFVYDSENKEPMDDAFVQLENDMNYFRGERDNEKGIYKFSNIPDNQYELFVYLKNYKKFSKIIIIDLLEPVEILSRRLVVDLEKEDIPKLIRINNVCLDNKKILQTSCQPIGSSLLDVALAPVTVTSQCPEGYHCGKEKCIQDKILFSLPQGDINGDKIVDKKDALELLTSLIQDSTSKLSTSADFDGDGIIDNYDLYRLIKYINGEMPADIALPVKYLTLDTLSKSIFQENYVSGSLSESKSNIPTKNWQIEFVQKGHSRNSCIPPELNIKFKKKDLFGGRSTYSDLQTLGYQKVRFVPDCDILQKHEVDNQVREYVLYSTYRAYGLPVNDVIGFASVNLNVPDKEITRKEKNQYFLLQRHDEKDDQTPFMKQFGFKEIIQPNESIFDGDDHTSDRLTQVNIVTGWQVEDQEKLDPAGKVPDRVEKFEPPKPILKTLLLEPNTSIRNRILENFFSLYDRGVLHNEYYGLDEKTGLWKPIPTDMDSSLNCGYYPKGWTRDVFEKAESQGHLSSEKKKEYATLLYRHARELFDNPDMLYSMLVFVDQYPFEENTIKMKNTLRWRFYYTALYYGSEEFANELGVIYVPFSHQADYEREAKRILASVNYRTMCSGSDSKSQDYQILQEFFDKKSNSGENVKIPVPKI